MYLTAIRQHMKREKLGDEHHAWDKVPELDDTPMEMRLTRKMYSSVWKKQINHTRCTDPDVVAQYDRRIKTDCTIENKYRNLEYTFTINLYAVTATHLYIPTDKEGDVCTLVLGNKTYLVFDELLLFIRTTPEELQREGIEKVSQIT